MSSCITSKTLIIKSSFQ